LYQGRALRYAASAVFGLALCAAGAAYAQTGPPVQPAALERLQAMSGFLSAHTSYSFEADAAFDDAVNATDNVQFHAAIHSYVRRPNQVKVLYAGDRRVADFYDDGKTFTIYDRRANRYGMLPADPTLAATLKRVSAKYHFSVPLADLYAPELLSALPSKIQRGYVVGPSVIAGVPTTHLAFFGANANMEIWIEDGSRPVPRKVVISYKKLPGVPQYTATFPKWDFAEIPESEFTFVPPAQSVRIDFLEDAK
jgi:hypothetical protein